MLYILTLGPFLPGRPNWPWMPRSPWNIAWLRKGNESGLGKKWDPRFVKKELFLKPEQKRYVPYRHFYRKDQVVQEDLLHPITNIQQCNFVYELLSFKLHCTGFSLCQWKIQRDTYIFARSSGVTRRSRWPWKALKYTINTVYLNNQCLFLGSLQAILQLSETERK